MSLGSIIGGIGGAIIGFFVGGPVGAFYGASIGFGIGMAVDPMTPDIPAPGRPDTDENVMQSSVGSSVPDLTGMAKITGHLLIFGKERNEPVYTKTSGGKGGGGSKKQITGYKYYMSWAVGICSGEVDTLYTIYKNDDAEEMWDGGIDGLSCPASGGKETIVIEDIGSVDFYFGTDDQAVNAKVGEIIEEITGVNTLNSPLRNMCWAFFDDCYIGEHNRTPTYKFVVKKIPSTAFNTDDTIQTYDVNPAHSLWYILNGMAGLPATWLDSTDWSNAADTLYAEDRGISVLFNKQQSVLNYIESINTHVDGIIRYDSDSKFHPKLIRDDYVDGDLVTIDESVMLDEPSFNRRSWIDTINEVKVQYSEIGRLKMYSTGYNNYGQLGLNDEIDRDEFTSVGSDTNWAFVACGGYHTLAIKVDGTLWAVGYNFYGQLGLGDDTKRDEFTQVGTDTNWESVACGSRYTMAIKTDGTLWGTGRNTYGQLGLDDEIERNEFTQVGSGTTWASVACGADYTIAIKTDGTLWGTGRNTYGQLGLGDDTKRDEFTQVGSGTTWASVACGGASHTIAIKTDGTLWGTGRNQYGQIGLIGETERDTFAQVGSDANWAVAACGYNHTMAIKTTGTLWATGYNYEGQLGLGDGVDRDEFTQVGSSVNWESVACGSSHTMAIKTTGTLWATGYNYYGSLGLDDTTKRDEFTQVGTDTNWESVACGTYFTISIKGQ